MTGSSHALNGPFTVRSRKGNFGNEDLAGALRLAYQQRHEPGVEFVEVPTGRTFSPAELIAAYDRMAAAASQPPPPVPSTGLGSFRDFATATVDLELPPGAEAPPGASPPAAAAPTSSTRSDRHAARTSQRQQRQSDRHERGSDRQERQSDRHRSHRGSNTVLIIALAIAALGIVVLMLVATRAEPPPRPSAPATSPR